MAKKHSAEEATKKRDEFRRALIARGLSILSVTKVSGAPYKLYRCIMADNTRLLIQRNPDDTWVLYREADSGNLEKLTGASFGAQ